MKMDFKTLALYAAAGFGAYCLYERMTKKEEDVQSSTTTTTTGDATPTPISFPEASYSTPYSSACGSNYNNRQSI